MKKVAQVWNGFEEAERAEEEYYASLTPQERLDIQLDLIAAYREWLGEAGQGLERVHRVTELARS